MSRVIFNKQSNGYTVRVNGAPVYTGPGIVAHDYFDLWTNLHGWNVTVDRLVQSTHVVLFSYPGDGPVDFEGWADDGR